MVDSNNVELIEQFLELLSFGCGDTMVIDAIRNYLLSRDMVIFNLSSFCTN